MLLEKFARILLVTCQKNSVTNAFLSDPISAQMGFATPNRDFCLLVKSLLDDKDRRRLGNAKYGNKWMVSAIFRSGPKGNERFDVLEKVSIGKH